MFFGVLAAFTLHRSLEIPSPFSFLHFRARLLLFFFFAFAFLFLERPISMNQRGRSLEYLSPINATQLIPHIFNRKN